MSALSRHEAADLPRPLIGTKRTSPPLRIAPSVEKKWRSQTGGTARFRVLKVWEKTRTVRVREGPSGQFGTHTPDRGYGFRARGLALRAPE